MEQDYEQVRERERFQERVNPFAGNHPRMTELEHMRERRDYYHGLWCAEVRRANSAENALRDLLPVFDNDNGTIPQLRRVYAKEIAVAEAIMKANESIRRGTPSPECSGSASAGGYSPCGGCSPESTSDYAACEGCRFNPDKPNLE